MEEASKLAKTLVAVEALVEAWQVTQEDVKLLLSSALSSELPNASELRARYRQVGSTSPMITRSVTILQTCFFVFRNLLTYFIQEAKGR